MQQTTAMNAGSMTFPPVPYPSLLGVKAYFTEGFSDQIQGHLRVVEGQTCQLGVGVHLGCDDPRRCLKPPLDGRCASFTRDPWDFQYYFLIHAYPLSDNDLVNPKHSSRG